MMFSRTATLDTNANDQSLEPNGVGSRSPLEHVISKGLRNNIGNTTCNSATTPHADMHCCYPDPVTDAMLNTSCFSSCSAANGSSRALAGRLAQRKHKRCYNSAPVTLPADSAGPNSPRRRGVCWITHWPPTGLFCCSSPPSRPEPPPSGGSGGGRGGGLARRVRTQRASQHAALAPCSCP